MSEDSGPDGSGQIEKGSVIAVKIEKRKKVLVLTPLGQEVIYSPAIRADGVKGDDRSGRSILFPWSDIRAVKIRRSGVGFGALIGFMAGAGLGYWGVTAIIDDPAGPAGSDYFRAMSILGGLGAIGGGLIGAVASGWKTVYTSPRGPRPVPRISLARTRRGGMAVSLSLAF